MTKEELQKTVNMNNRFIKNQRDMKVCELLYQIVVIQCKKNGWNPTQFFQEGGKQMNTIKIKDFETVLEAEIVKKQEISDGMLYTVMVGENKFSVIQHPDGTIVSQHDWQAKPVTVEEIKKDYVRWVDVTP